MSEQIQSEILSEEQVQGVVNDTPVQEEETSLPSEQREELIGGKFKSQEDLLTAYQNLEKKLGQPKEEASPEPEPEVDEEYVKWKQEKELDKFLEPVGGKEAYFKALEWARGNMNEAEITEFNEALKGAEGNEATTRLLVKSLIDKSTQQQQVPSVPNQTIHANQATKPKQVTGYETKSDMLKDMSDPRYEKDQSFRNKVAAKLQVTDEANWYKGIARGG